MKYQKNEAKAWARKNLPGINGGIIQPLNKDYSIDYEGTKAWINRQIEMGVDAAYQLAGQTMACNMIDPAAQEGTLAFLEKRKPNW